MKTGDRIVIRPDHYPWAGFTGDFVQWSQGWAVVRLDNGVEVTVWRDDFKALGEEGEE